MGERARGREAGRNWWLLARLPLVGPIRRRRRRRRRAAGVLK